MFGSFRRHQKWIWLLGVIVIIPSFVIFFSPEAKYSGRGATGSRVAIVNGKPPTNQPLLDWLAVELMDGEQAVKPDDIPRRTPPARQGETAWRMKHIHRLIVTSNAYRQQSSTAGADESNRRAYLDLLGRLLRNVEDAAESEAAQPDPPRLIVP